MKSVVATGYGHYTTLLPTAFEDAGTDPKQLAGMLAFLFTLESLALSLGCSRTQFEIAVKQSGSLTTDHTKLGLLWTTEWLLGLRTADAIRAHFDDLLANPMAAGAMPAQLQGFLLALQFTPLVTRLVAELVGKAFERLPDHVLMPWLPGLLMMFRDGGEATLTALFKEASANLPNRLAGLKDWQPPWHAPAATPAAPAAVVKPMAGAIPKLVADHPATLYAMARLLGFEATPISVAASDAPAGTPELLRTHPATLNAVARLIS